MTARLAEATWPDLAGAAVVLVPVGSVEQHGPHLPADTDTLIATAVTDQVAARIPGSWVAPPLAFTASGEHQGFPGTCSIGTEVLTSVIVELVRSIRLWADRVVFVNAHGGNLSALRKATEQLRREGHLVDVAVCGTERPAVEQGLPPDLHAGRIETSLLLHLRPELVRSAVAAAGDCRPLTEIMPELQRGGVAAVSANGVLGDPTGATAGEGAALLAAIVDQVHRDLTARR